MTRQLRIQFPDAFYHVTSRGNERQNIFRDDEDYILFLEKLKGSLEIYNVTLLSYVCMNNHFHLLLTTPDENLSDFMRHFNISYTSAFNKRHNRSGHLYQGRYKSFLIDADNYLQEVSRYIHLNPIRVKTYAKKNLEEKIKIIEDFKFSSLQGYLNLEQIEEFVNYSAVLDYFGGDNEKGRELYRDFIRSGLENSDENLLKTGKGSGIIGSDEFIGKIQDKYIDSLEKKYKRELPGLKKIRKKFQPSELIEEYCKYTGVDLDLICVKGKNSDDRAILMELLYRYCNLTQVEIGEIAGGIDYSSVSYARKRLKLKIEKDKALKKKFVKIDEHFSSSLMGDTINTG